MFLVLNHKQTGDFKAHTGSLSEIVDIDMNILNTLDVQVNNVVTDNMYGILYRKNMSVQ